MTEVTGRMIAFAVGWVACMGVVFDLGMLAADHRPHQKQNSQPALCGGAR